MKNSPSISSKDQFILISPIPSSSSISVTDEDSLGNPLPTQMVEILKSNRLLEKKVTKSLFSKSSPNIQNFSSISIPSTQNLSQILLTNSAFKPFFSKIEQLKSTLDEAKQQLQRSELCLIEAESENLSLSQRISSLQGEENLISKSNCSCNIN